MKPYLRRSIFTKAAALGFIAMILLGNLWMVQFLTGQQLAAWMSHSFVACMVWTAAAGLGMGVRIIQNQFLKDRDDNAAV